MSRKMSVTALLGRCCHTVLGDGVNTGCCSSQSSAEAGRTVCILVHFNDFQCDSIGLVCGLNTLIFLLETTNTIYT